MNFRIVSLAALVLGATAAQANFVQNGSFEDVSLAGQGWGLFDSINGGWYASVDKIEVGHADIYGVTGQDGTNILELDANQNATVNQNLTLAAGTYNLSFLMAARAGTDVSSNLIDVLWNGAKVATYSPTSTTFSSTSLNLTSLGHGDVLSFRGAGTSDSLGSIVDNVNVQAVPEPTTLAAIGMGALGLLRRRRKA